MIDAAAFLASAYFLLQLPLPDRAQRVPASFVHELRDGWRELTSRTWCGRASSRSASGISRWPCSSCSGPWSCRTSWAARATGGLILSGSSVGALLGGAIALRWKPSRPLVAVFGATVVRAAQLFLLIPPAPVLAMAGAAVLAMIGVIISITVWTTTVQQHVPEHALARVTAYDCLGSLVVMPLGYALAGPVAALIGVDATLRAPVR
ncbi:MAG: hypothetical protein ABR583_10735 [Gaiellaceae bacterium]